VFQWSRIPGRPLPRPMEILRINKRRKKDRPATIGRSRTDSLSAKSQAQRTRLAREIRNYDPPLCFFIAVLGLAAEPGVVVDRAFCGLLVLLFAQPVTNASTRTSVRVENLKSLFAPYHAFENCRGSERINCTKFYASAAQTLRGVKQAAIA
jgi:hypothetical protein